MGHMMPLFRRLLLLSCVFALFVVMLGAYTRLTDAGLGCPDWPGCYGHMVVESTVIDSTKACDRNDSPLFCGHFGFVHRGFNDQ